MSKQEVLALARDGKAHIEETESYVVTRYWIGPAPSEDLDGPAIRVDISEYGVEDAFFYAPGKPMVNLTPTEAEMVVEAIGVSLTRA
jgi:hypothetical protein